MNALINALAQHQWGLHRPVLQHMIDLLLRRAAGERAGESEIARVVAQRGQRDGEEQELRIAEGGVAVVPVSGIIVKGAAGVRNVSGPRGTNTGAVRRAMEQAMESAEVRAVVLEIDSPGGSVAGIEALSNFIARAGRRKPVVAYASDMAASAAYWLASQAERVLTNGTGEVGSIGVYGVVMDSSAAYDEAGLKIHVLRSGEHKGMGTPGDTVTDSQLAEYQRVIDGIFKVFVRHVASGRDMNVAEVRELADGRIFVGAEAAAVGLVDRVGSLEDALAEARRLASERPGGPNTAAAEPPANVRLVSLLGADDMNGKRVRTVAATAVENPTTATAGAEAAEEQVEAPQPIEENAAATPPIGRPEPGQIDKDAAAAGARAERQRVKQIRAMGQRVGLSAKWIDARIDDGSSIEQARAEALEELGRSRRPANVVVGEDLNRSTLAAAMVDAICLRAGTEVKKPHERSAEFRGLRLFSLARRFLELHGTNTAGRTDDDVCREVFRLRGSAVPFAAGGGSFSHSTSDFPLILADASAKRLRQAYTEAPSTWDVPGLMRRRTVPDYKDIKAYQLGEAADLLEVKEGGEYTEATIGEAREVYKVKKYGRLFSHTREMLINDDLDAFSRIPALHGAAARRLEEAVAWLPITTAELGEAMSDGNTIFDATNHSNYTATGAAPSVASLGVAQKSFRMQTGLSGVRLNLAPSFLIVPAALEVTTKQLIGSSVDPAGSNSNVPNPFRGMYSVIVNPVLDAMTNGTTAWYMFCNVSAIDTIEVAFLEGNEQPFLDQEEGFRVDGITYKVRHEVGAKCIDWRGVYKNKGA